MQYCRLGLFKSIYYNVLFQTSQIRHQDLDEGKSQILLFYTDLMANSGIKPRDGKVKNFIGL